MNKEQRELLDEAYKNWKAKGRDFWEEQIDGMFTSELGEEKVDKISKEEFINKCKTDPEFSKTWGLKIEERELTTSEIWSYIHNNKIEIKHQHAVLSGHPIGSELRKQFIPVLKENYNIPTKLITLTYNNKTIESYE